MPSASTIGDWLINATAKLQAAGVDTPRLDAQLLLCHYMDIDRAQIIGFPEREISDEITLNKLLQRRILREPLSHIIGKREFWSLDFIVNADVLDPRPDSETLVEVLLDRINDKNAALHIIDFGTGSGCLLLALLSELPNATGIGVDVSNKALDVAKLNAKNLNFINRCNFVQSSWGENLSQRADIIISNPPYIPAKDIEGLQREVKNYEPRLALDGGVDGLNPYPLIADFAYKHLNKKGLIGFEFGIGQEKDVAKILKDGGFIDLMYHKDLGLITRCLTASL